MKQLASFLALLTAIAPIIAFASNHESYVRYPRPETEFDRRTDYPLRLLQLSLDKAGSHAILVPTSQIMPQGRALTQLRFGVDVDVVWSMTSRQRESNLQAIRVPIYKGLIGWRIFLAHQQDLEKFNTEMSLADLRKFQLIQGHDWPDTEILRANGFEVLGTPNYKSIFGMLSKRRVDLFPRSIVEIWSEAETHKAGGIVVEPTKLLIYPTAFYYFVNPSNVSLAISIEKGLTTALADGSYDKLFFEYHQEIIDKAKLESRQIFRLNNPLLPLETPLNKDEMWFSLENE